MAMAEHAWVERFPGAVTVCDAEGVIVEMNDRAAEVFAAEGGQALVGTSLLSCHPEPARSRLLQLLRTGRTNVYTIEKHGVRKLIYQSPWYRGGRFAGLVEISLELPAQLPHFVRH
jgi:transcriptional regulator with PAS, ATPase and Fis domain